MDFTGEELIAAPRDLVWAALNDPEIMRGCIPGCQRIERLPPDAFEATIKVKFSLLSATFHGLLTLSNVDAPKSYTLSAEGKGGIAGFARGSADIVLEERGDETILHYRARAELGGKLAQLGARLLDSTSQKLAVGFFSDFNAAVVAKAATG
ncbi:SRPBCC family protein [Rhizobium bangladeshense]|uniref:SRPBCC family protein n=1 Tax=Rhizobium bangladeshense TaxID=1138189 RepID=UPI001C82B097|nr:carbon monoxide dehydrogenase subunit G [Rhizobium bangladeshense]MBX4889179.1 carbon monoxide dehydrogenase subunit G [Rhizobium bangladeshense]MBX4896086.1 carbon monoxide dehydrogenase subunit G [Rhizobium bangladeshense]MBX4903079.1 carbon monoxide dehydrogenase subunit G [Rhizobium bangladeshense]MBX4914464.1 carbon monoxide dehydrogenase subunit G [Rhizobium bangladeshense]MBX4918492.1 carbon monoxide dehydrogenase subunit G [Rhizobium bangladeshense]